LWLNVESHKRVKDVGVNSRFF